MQTLFSKKNELINKNHRLVNISVINALIISVLVFFVSTFANVYLVAPIIFMLSIMEGFLTKEIKYNKKEIKKIIEKIKNIKEKENIVKELKEKSNDLVNDNYPIQYNNCEKNAIKVKKKTL